MASSSSNVSSLFLGIIAIILLFLCSVVCSHPSNHHSWQSFRTLSGCNLGEGRPGLADLKRYLHHFGYLKGSTPTGDDNYTDDFDAELESAVIAYQNFFNLTLTGRLDAPTLHHITAPRCGLPDLNVVINGTATFDRRRSLYSFFNGRPAWRKRRIQYAFASMAGAPSNREALRMLFARAFDRWSTVTPLSFSETSQGNNADITIAFAGLDGPGNYLAWAYPPTDGRMIIDKDEKWRVQGGMYDLESLVTHEIGHLLGLYHSQDPRAIMFPKIPPGTRKVALSMDDISGIRVLYPGGP